jgi:UDP-N-acetylmuramoylalanine--D-glutamate ligase
MLRAWDPSTVLAGNMGVTALGQLDRIGPQTPVVLELSSWQLEALIEHGLSPHLAVLTNVSEDHLDHYDGYADYAATKRGITRHQRPDDYLIVNRDNPDAWRASEETVARVLPFGATDRGGEGAWLVGDRFVWRWGNEDIAFERPGSLALAGEHGALNALAALAAARLRGASSDAIRQGLDGFGGVPHRQEVVAEVDGVTFVNDTAATAPAAAIAALRTLTGDWGRRVHLIAGGHDKKTDLTDLASEAALRATTIHLLEGTATPGFAALLRAAGANPCGPYRSMEHAVSAARAEAQSGDIVLLSPGCASFGLFRDEFDRGDRFRETVVTLARIGGGAQVNVETAKR